MSTLTGSHNNKLSRALQKAGVKREQLDQDTYTALQEISSLEDGYDDGKTTLAPSEYLISQAIVAIDAMKRHGVKVPMIGSAPPDALLFDFGQHCSVSGQIYQLPEEPFCHLWICYTTRNIKDDWQKDIEFKGPQDLEKYCEVLQERLAMKSRREW